MQEDDVEDDPADRQQAEKCPVHRGQAGKLGGHTEGNDRNRQRAQQANDRGQMGPHVKREQSKQHYNRNRRSERGQQYTVERVVDLSPNHLFLPLFSWISARAPRHAGERVGSARGLFGIIIWPV